GNDGRGVLRRGQQARPGEGHRGGGCHEIAGSAAGPARHRIGNSRRRREFGRCPAGGTGYPGQGGRTANLGDLLWPRERDSSPEADRCQWRGSGPRGTRRGPRGDYWLVRAERAAELMAGKGFFAIDRRTWGEICDARTISEAAAYLVLAAGTGADNRSTSWS